MGRLRVIIPAAFQIDFFVPALNPFQRPILWLSRLTEVCAWVLLVSGLLLGLAWGGLHFWIVPRIDDFRPSLERLAQKTLGVPIQIGGISAQSVAFAPSFELTDIRLLDPEGRSALYLPKVQLAISIRSVLGLKLEQLVLDGPEVEVLHLADGSWRVAGFDWSDQSGGDSPMADWLFAQREVLVRGGTLHWTQELQAPKAWPKVLQPLANMAAKTAQTAAQTAPQTAPQPTPQMPKAPNTVSLTDVDVVMRNSARHHDMRMDASPPEGLGARFVTMGRFKRGFLSLHPGRWADWSGQVYAFFPQLDLAQWGRQLPGGANLNAGQGQARLWGDLANGQWTGGLADLNLTDLQTRWQDGVAPLRFERISGRLGAQITPLGFEANTQQLAFVSDKGLVWPGGNATLTYTHPKGKTPASGRLQADHLDLFALREAALQLPLPKVWRARLESQEVSGEVSALNWRWQGDWQSPSRNDLQAQLQDLSLPPATPQGNDPAPGWPGLKAAQAKISLNQDSARVEVDMGPQGSLFLPGLLAQAQVPVKALHAEANFKRQGQQWQVPLWKLQFENADLQGQWQGQWQASPTGKGPGVVDLKGLIKRLDATQAYRYLPLDLPESVRLYVRDALVSGHYVDVQTRIQGDLDKMPFADPKAGEFRLAGRVQDVQLDYLPAQWLADPKRPWPRLHKLSGQLVFDRLSMRLSDATARADDPQSGLLLTAGHADISDMAHTPMLNVAAENKGAAMQVLGLVNASPLGPLLSNALRQAQATGNLQTRFKLSIPLLEPEKTLVQGALVLANTDLQMGPEFPVLERLQGTVQFSESGFNLVGAQGRLLGGPVRIEGGMANPAGSPNAPSDLQLSAQGQMTAEGLRATKELAPLNAWAQHASGETPYTAQLAWKKGHPELAVQSSLAGLALQLPAPLGKPAATSAPLSALVRMQSTNGVLQDQLQLDWGPRASAFYERDVSGPNPRVLRGSLTLGLPRTQAPSLPDKGVFAYANLAHFSLDEWQALLPPAAGLVAKPAASPLPAWQAYLPTVFGLQAGSMTAEGRTLHTVVAGGLREGNHWLVNVDASELSGHLDYRQATDGQLAHLYARLSRLNLPPSSVADVEELLEAPPESLPSLDIVVEHLELRGKKLGRIEIEAVNTVAQQARIRNAPEWQLKKLNISVPEATLQSTGRWLAASDGRAQRRTEMQFKLAVSDAGALLERLGTPDALRGGTGKLEGQVGWQGSPMALHYPSMSGQFDVQMGRGQFLKADAGVAKLLGVLSLQALPRRLLLDFRDVFYEGFAFDSVRGDVTITQGIANTRNMQIKGVNALVQLDGSANIAEESQNLRVVILPALDAGTVSLLAGIALNPVVGLTTFLAQLFLQKPLAKANTQEFLIDGSWAEPRVTKVNANALPASPSPANPSMP